jgi:hypothetical protein
MPVIARLTMHVVRIAAEFLASFNLFKKMDASGPLVALQTPTVSANLACARRP